jgi:putative tricarboxylic transport membrane protein
VLLGSTWFHQAAAIQDSLLSDAVGAGGVPKVLAAIMTGAGMLLVLRTLLRPPAAEPGRSRAAHAKAAGLFAAMVLYVLAAPVLGYPLALGLFGAAVALYAGARANLTTALFGIGMAGLFWLGFVKLLGVAFPTGVLFGG